MRRDYFTPKFKKSKNKRVNKINEQLKTPKKYVRPVFRN